MLLFTTMLFLTCMEMTVEKSQFLAEVVLITSKDREDISPGPDFQKKSMGMLLELNTFEDQSLRVSVHL